jgi:hypothetical protein
MLGAKRVCTDTITRVVCSNKPTFVSFHADSTCNSIGNCSVSTHGACLSPPLPEDFPNPWTWPCISGDSESMCYSRPHDMYWFPQHAPGYSCLGYGNAAVNNTILRQRGACWALEGAPAVKRCHNNTARAKCMERAGFLGFNASKTCSQTRNVSAFGAPHCASQLGIYKFVVHAHMCACMPSDFLNGLRVTPLPSKSDHLYHAHAV